MTTIALRFLFLGLLAASLAGPAQAAPCLPPGPLAFDLYNDGEAVGTLAIDLERQGRETVAVLRIDVAVGFMGATLYRYRHRSRERWRGAAFLDFEGRTDDNGRIRDVRIATSGTRYALERNGEESEVEALLLSHLMWCPALLADRPVLSTLNGKTREARVVALGTRRPAFGRDAPATGYRVTQKGRSGEVWYDSDGRLLAASFPTVIGSTARILRRP